MELCMMKGDNNMNNNNHAIIKIWSLQLNVSINQKINLRKSNKIWMIKKEKKSKKT